MANGLAVTAEGANLTRRHPRFIQQFQHRPPKQPRYRPVQPHQPIQFIPTRLGQRQQFFLQPGRQGRRAPGEQFRERRIAIAKPHQRGINAVHAGAGHQAHQVICHVQESCRFNGKIKWENQGGNHNGVGPVC